EIEAALAREGASAPVVSSAGALVAALRALGARRIAMVTPYLKPLTRLVADYIEDAGVEVHDALSLEVPDNRDVAALPPADLADGGGDALHRGEPHVAAREDARNAGLQEVRVAVECPAPRCAHV